MTCVYHAYVYIYICLGMYVYRCMSVSVCVAWCSGSGYILSCIGSEVLQSISNIYIYIKIFNLNNRWFVPCTSIHTCTCWACEVKLSTVLDPSNVETQVVDEATDNVNIDASPVMSDASLHIITYGSSSALT